MKKYLLGVVCAFLLCMHGSVSPVNAALFNVDFNYSTGKYSGMHWTGLVNTTTDTLSINSWTENAGFPTLWTPANLPMIWNAVDATGSSFDVPDDWDGVIGAGWGFLSPVLLSSISFNEGTWIGAVAKPGWGILFSGGSIQANFDNTYLPVWPRYESTPWFTVGADVQVTAVVPIPGAVWLLGSGLIGFVGLRRKLKK